jgi:hypothetical protein
MAAIDKAAEDAQKKLDAAANSAGPPGTAGAPGYPSAVEAAKTATSIPSVADQKAVADAATLDAFNAQGAAQVADAQPVQTHPPADMISLKTEPTGEQTIVPVPFGETPPPLVLTKPAADPATVAAVPAKATQTVPAVNKPADLPTIKEQLAYLAKKNNLAQSDLDQQGTAEIVHEAIKNPSFADMLKKIGFPILGIIQALGYGLAGKSDQKTVLDTAQEQKFAREQQDRSAAIQNLQQQAQNDFEMKKAALLQQYNVQNMTAQQKAELDQALAQIAAQHAARMQEIPAEVEAYVARTRAVAGMAANPSAFWGAGGK